MENPRIFASLSSICVLASSASYIAFFTSSGFLNHLQLIAACAFLSLRYFVTVCLWSNHRMSYWRGASMSLSAHFSLDSRHFVILRPLLTVKSCWKVFWSVFKKNVNICADNTQVQIDYQQGISNVPLCNVNLEIGIFRRWSHNPFSSAYFFLKSPYHSC